MAQWLITVKTDCDLDALSQEISDAGGRIEELSPIPLGDELAVYADGEEAFAQRIKDVEKVVDVFPHSPPEAH